MISSTVRSSGFPAVAQMERCIENKVVSNPRPSRYKLFSLSLASFHSKWRQTSSKIILKKDIFGTCFSEMSKKNFWPLNSELQAIASSAVNSSDFPAAAQVGSCIENKAVLHFRPSRYKIILALARTISLEVTVWFFLWTLQLWTPNSELAACIRGKTSLKRHFLNLILTK